MGGGGGDGVNLKRKGEFLRGGKSVKDRLSF